MEFFDDDGKDEEVVLLDLEEVLIDQKGEIIRTEDIVQAPSNPCVCPGALRHTTLKWIICRKIIKISMIGKSNHFFFVFFLS